ncbi:hypothetical protein JHK85_036394 [Glycine max]|nr:hypothetical protein JHK85_036394 [Glycine max]
MREKKSDLRKSSPPFVQFFSLLTAKWRIVLPIAKEPKPSKEANNSESREDKLTLAKNEEKLCGDVKLFNRRGSWRVNNLDVNARVMKDFDIPRGVGVFENLAVEDLHHLVVFRTFTVYEWGQRSSETSCVSMELGNRIANDHRRVALRPELTPSLARLYDGDIPSSIEELLLLLGVGPKIAHLKQLLLAEPIRVYSPSTQMLPSSSTQFGYDCVDQHKRREEMNRSKKRKGNGKKCCKVGLAPSGTRVLVRADHEKIARKRLKNMMRVSVKLRHGSF